MSSPTRTYLGESAENRIQARRQLLVDTAFALMASEGWRRVSIDGLCREAKLNKRYFYESFADLQELAAAVVDDLASQLLKVGLESVRTSEEAEASTHELTRSALAAVVRHLAEDPRRARVLFTEVADSPQATAHRKMALRAFSRTISDFAHRHQGAREPEPAADLGSALLLGGTIEAILAWLDGTIRLSQAAFVDDLAAMWTMVGDGTADLVRARHSQRSSTKASSRKGVRKRTERKRS